MEMLLIRHGLPVHTINRDGTPADPPLSEVGHQQAHLLSEWLKEERIDRIYSSPLRRARETADPLARRTGLEIELEARISEFDAGVGSFKARQETAKFNQAMQGRIRQEYAYQVISRQQRALGRSVMVSRLRVTSSPSRPSPRVAPWTKCWFS